MNPQQQHHPGMNQYGVSGLAAAAGSGGGYVNSMGKALDHSQNKKFWACRIKLIMIFLLAVILHSLRMPIN